MSQRAECVMLNKGPYIEEAISALDSILTRMHDHHDKKRSLLRRLHAWESAAPRRAGVLATKPDVSRPARGSGR
jgi:pyruvate kinase